MRVILALFFLSFCVTCGNRPAAERAICTIEISGTCINGEKIDLYFARFLHSAYFQINDENELPLFYVEYGELSFFSPENVCPFDVSEITFQAINQKYEVLDFKRDDFGECLGAAILKRSDAETNISVTFFEEE